MSLEPKMCQRIADPTVIATVIQPKEGQLRLLFTEMQKLGYDVELQDDITGHVLYIGDKEKRGRDYVLPNQWVVLFPDSKTVEVYGTFVFSKYYTLIEENIEKEPTKEHEVYVMPEPVKEPSTILKQFIRNEVKKQLSECFSQLLNVD
jgi:hypothetical protein